MKSFVFLSMFFVSNLLFSQSSINKEHRMSPKSPNVGNIDRYGTYEVNLYNGLPDISIPLFEIKTDFVTIPIKLSYHAGGVKVSDVASWVGLGWSLHTGGTLSRNVKGHEDENGILYWPTHQVPNSSTLNPYTLEGYSTIRSYLPMPASNFSRNDGEPDVFQYSLPNEHGHFIFKDKNTPIFIPEKPFNIDLVQNQNYRRIDKIRLTNTEGIEYSFGQNSENGDIMRETTSLSIGGNSDTYTSAWNLMEVKSNISNKTISYNYHPVESFGLPMGFKESVVVNDNVVRHLAGVPIPVTPSIENRSTDIFTSVSQNLLKSIVFPGGKLEFTLSPQKRLDINGSSLQEIRIYSMTPEGYVLYKRVQLNYEYFRGKNNTKRLKLSSLVFLSSESPVQTYNFTYNEELELPDPTFSNSVDLWGYYNNKYNTTLVPKQDIIFYGAINDHSTGDIRVIGGSPGGRDVDVGALQTGILEKITFPTGGYTLFRYEGNKYTQGGNVSMGGGLRIGEVLSYSSNNTLAFSKRYLYGLEPGDTSGVGLVNSLSTLYIKPTKRKNAYFEWIVGALSSILGHTWTTTVYGTGMSHDNNDFDNVSVYYPFVTEVFGRSHQNVGKIETLFSHASDKVITAFMEVRPVVETQHWKRGHVLNRKVYNNLNRLLKEESFNYITHNQKAVDDVGFMVEEFVIFSGKYSESDNYDAAYGFLPFKHAFYDLERGSYKMSSYRETSYDGAASVTKSVGYEYNSKGLYSKIKELDSKGDTLVKYFKYPNDYNYSSYLSTADGKAIRGLVDRNYISLPIEHVEGVKRGASVGITKGIFRKIYDDKPVVKTEYSLDSPSPVLNFQLSSFSFSDSINRHVDYRPYLYFSQYNDYLKPIEVKRNKEATVSYLWDKESENLLTEVTNANAGTRITTNTTETSGLHMSLNPGDLSGNTVSFTVDYTGQITLLLNQGTFLSAGTTVYINYTLHGPVIKTGTLCMNNIVGNGCHFSNLSAKQAVLTGIPAGTYELSIHSSTPVSGTSATVSYTYPKAYTTVSGKEFFYNGFEESSTAAANSFIGDRYHQGSYTVPFLKPDGKEYVVDYKFLQNGKWNSKSMIYNNNMILSDGDAIDEVRVYPVRSRMKSYTYRPLVGMTSSTDESGNVEVYRYDNFQRLKDVLDFEGNVLKSYNYHYKQ